VEIKVYTKSNCLSSKEVIRFFKVHHILYTEVNVTNDQERFNEMLKLGGIATPFIIIGDQIFHSFTRSEIKRTLKIM
jgi:glutaredoxin